MRAVITAERPDTDDGMRLISELEAQLAPFYPKTSRHGYSVEKLMQQAVAFFVTRHDGVAAGCGGIELFGTEYGEIKRMYVRPQFRGLGLAKLMLDHLAAYARERGVHLLRLETGIHQTEAIALYEGAGFLRIPPFGSYHEDPLSRFYEKRLGWNNLSLKDANQKVYRRNRDAQGQAGNTPTALFENFDRADIDSNIAKTRSGE